MLQPHQASSKTPGYWGSPQVSQPGIGSGICHPLGASPVPGMPGGSSGIGIVTQPPRERVSFLHGQPQLLMFCSP